MKSQRSRVVNRASLVGGIAALAVALSAGPAFADIKAAKKWIENEFQPSTLSKGEQLKEMEWFIKAAAPFKGMAIKVVSETIPTHEYESKVLTKAFEEITGIKVTHDLIGMLTIGPGALVIWFVRNYMAKGFALGRV